MMQRPASVIVFGVLNLVFGTLGLFALPIMIHATLTGANQQFQFVDDSSAFRVWSYLSLALSAFGVVALIASGIGLLRMRSWARNLAIAYAALTIVTTLIALVMHWLYVAQPTLERFAGEDTPEAMGAKFGAIGGLIGGVIGMAYPVLVWFFMTRPRVLAAFAAQNPGQQQPIDAGSTPRYDFIPRNDPANPYSAPTTSEQPVWNPEAGDPSSITETFIPSKNGPALASYYLGIFSLFPCLGFPLGVAAVYYGIQGIRRVRKNPEVRGGVHAWVGTICGALFGLFNFALITLMIIGIAANASR